VSGSDSRPCETQTADAHPDIKWLESLHCILDGKEDTATIAVTEYMTSGLYRFIAECDDSEGGVQRVFEYKDRDRPYLVRFSDRVDPKTYTALSITSSVNTPTITRESSRVLPSPVRPPDDCFAAGRDTASRARRLAVMIGYTTGYAYCG
jgi:hypothetical protein